MRIFLLLLTLLCVTLSQVVQYKITYSIANANNAGSEDSQYVKITGSEGEIEEQECESADFDNRGDYAECLIESDINIGDYGCVHLRTGGRNGLDLIKVKVEINGTEVHTILPQDGDRYIELDDYGKKVFCKVGSSSTVEVCEKKNHLASIDCGEGVIEVEDAVYGVHSNDNTCGVELSRGDGKCEAATSLQEVQDKCDGESFCRLEAKNGIFGDPCPGVAKYLTVTWKCNSLIREGSSDTFKEFFSDMRSGYQNINENLTKVHWLTSVPVKISTYIYLRLDFSGQYTEGCGLALNIWDKESMYHLDFRINYKDFQKTLTQSVMLDGRWLVGQSAHEAMNLRKGANDIEVTVGEDYFKASINGVKFKETVPVDPLRLSNYENILIIQKANCASFNSDMSYVQTPNNDAPQFDNAALSLKTLDAQGEEGPQGDSGPQGLPGAVGDKGSQGTNDFCSSPSPTICSLEGAQGEPGDDGSDGNDGLKGDQGPQGEQGERGRDGVDGDNGAQGEQGEDGEDGEDGEKGMNGEQNCEAKSCAGLKLGRCYGASSATLTVQCREGYGAASIWKNTRFWGLKCCKFVVK